MWNAEGTLQTGHLPAVICADLPPWPERHGLIAGEMFDGSERRGLWVVVAREPITLRVIRECRPGEAARWVRHAKDAIRLSEEWVALKNVDPLEQMRQMAESIA